MSNREAVSNEVIGALHQRISFALEILLVLLVMALSGAKDMCAQAKAAQAPGSHIPVVMLSDLHFDPFHDPAKVRLLVKASVANWDHILEAPDDPGQQTAFATVQGKCKAKENSDTPFALLKSSLLAAKGQAPEVAFVTVSGDLLVHDLDCRYRATMDLEASTTDDQSVSAAFAEKTTIYVINKIKAAFPRVPVYIALGNNDSRCNHNRLDPHDAYLKASASAVADGWRGVSPSEKAAALGTFESAGYYALTIPAPISRTRLLVVNDIYMMPKYATCDGDDNDTQGAREQTAWLQSQLEKSRRNGERVWLLGHLPPAVNADNLSAETGAFCASGKVVKFQSTDDLANEMAAYPDILKLGIFGHTHMDELRLLRAKGGGVPVKVVGSVSPVSGNRPSFVVGLVDLASSKLVDYTVYEASNSTGVGTKWPKEYAFDETYHEADFSAESLSDLISRFRDDTTAAGQESRSYEEYYSKGSTATKKSFSWPAYVCALDNSTAAAFKACVCQEK
ncbi:metallophosphoesterase [Granulicella sibirica]|uniref:Acid sphingomyelinase-like phosphodiesterase 3b n=1 Tax=Granulicella sibirica TaxID=2479048 RepID=A0A4Q0SYA9_9BACT|nr:metallophosphoesterase [Granulicella sibirica]RXH54171.1 Acid sphingomyelinase-like phosphodiesterase 3b precursor [Granulicella sibirica]